MCRFLAVRGDAEAVHAFLNGEAPRQFQMRSRRHTAGWGIAAYEAGVPELIRRPVWVRDDTAFLPALTAVAAPTVLVHVRRATRGEISIENTHPFTHGRWSFAHNGTIVNRVTGEIREWLQPPVAGQTDSEAFFHLLLHFIAEHGGDVTAGVRAGVAWVLARSPKARLNFVLTDGERIFAYRRGHTLYHFLEEFDGRLVEGVASDNLGGRWRSIGRDWMLTLDGHPSHDRLDKVRLSLAAAVPPP